MKEMCNKMLKGFSVKHLSEWHEPEPGFKKEVFKGIIEGTSYTRDLYTLKTTFLNYYDPNLED